jgi:hypothetical protein
MRRGLTGIAVLTLGLAVLACHPAAPAHADPEPGGLTSSKLFVHARLGQPPGRGAGRSGAGSGWALRYLTAQPRPNCIVTSRSPNAADQPWFGTDGNPLLVEVVLVNRADPSVRLPQGEGCLQPADLTQVPTPGEVLDALRATNIPEPKATLSPGGRGLTGLQTWYWFEGPGQANVGLGIRGFSVTAQAKATAYHWSTGDGAAYSSAVPGSQEAPAARHIYDRRSRSNAVTLDMTWSGSYTWTYLNDAGAEELGPVTVEGAPQPYAVNEVRSVLQ